ncbi:MAG: GAF domain-containing protein [Oscillatoriales cyanobacterium]|nr:MAG: GAF domain-containing protein [Oscillatoriales cyanobacterium]
MNDESIVSPLPSALAANNDLTLDLGRVLQRLRVTDGTEMLVKVVIDFLRDQFARCPLIWLGLYDRRTHKVTGKGGVLPSDNRRALRHSFGLMAGDTLEQVVVQQRPIYIANLQREKNAGDWSRAARQAGIQSAFVLPVASRKKCLGLVVLGSEQMGFELDILETTQLSIVLGEFANILALRELEELRIQAQHPHTVLLTAMQHLQRSDPFGRCIERVLEEVHQFIRPTQTQLYWIDRDRQCFVRHELAITLEGRDFPSWIDTDRAVPLPLDLVADFESSGLLISAFAGFHDHLLKNQPVAIGESYSSLSSADTGKLMFHLKARSLLAAPLWHHQGDRGELLGFLAVTAHLARMWTKDEQQFLHGVSRSIALATSAHRATRSYQQLQRNHTATLALAEASHHLQERTSPPPTHATALETPINFEAIATQLCTHLAVQQVAILQRDPTQDTFIVAFQRSPAGSSLPSPLPTLSLIDYQLLERSTQAIALEDIGLSLGGTFNAAYPAPSRHNHDIDVRFSAWQPHFAAAGWTAIALCNVHRGKPPEFLIVVGSPQPSPWPASTLRLLEWAGQQIATQIDRIQVDHSNHELQTALTTIVQGMSDLQQHPLADTTERAILKRVCHWLEADFVALLQLPKAADRPMARVVYATGSHDRPPPIAPGLTIPLENDRLIQDSISSQGFLGPLAVAELSEATRSWLGTSLVGHIYLLALRPDPDSPASGLFIAADRGQRWDDRRLSPARLLLEALAQAERSDQILNLLHTKRHTLEPLNWYKHRQLESLYWTLGTAGRQIERLVNQLEVNPGGETSRTIEVEREQLYGQQTLRVLGENLESLKTRLQQEQWQLSFASEPVSLVSLLKRVLERCDPILKKRQLWLQVHREGNTIVQGDRQKLELIFYELLTWACQRSAIGGRLDIWYRPITLEAHPNTPLLELAITDSGVIDTHLIEIFHRSLNPQQTYNLASLTTPELDRPPGIYLTVYHRIMTAMGGYFNLDAIDDGRVVTRLLIPLIEDESRTLLLSNDPP